MAKIDELEQEETFKRNVMMNNHKRQNNMNLEQIEESQMERDQSSQSQF